MKKILSVLLTILMALCICSINVVAEDDEVAEDNGIFSSTISVIGLSTPLEGEYGVTVCEDVKIEGVGTIGDVRINWYDSKGEIFRDKFEALEKYTVKVVVRVRDVNPFDLHGMINNEEVDNIYLDVDKKLNAYAVLTKTYVAKKVVNLPSKEELTHVYNGESQRCIEDNDLFHAELIAFGQTLKATDAGQYSITLCLNDKDNCVWKKDDGTYTSDDQPVFWYIDQCKIDKPEISSIFGTLYYANNKEGSSLNVELLVKNYDYYLEKGVTLAIRNGDEFEDLECSWEYVDNKHWAIFELAPREEPYIITVKSWNYFSEDVKIEVHPLPLGDLSFYIDDITVTKGKDSDSRAMIHIDYSKEDNDNTSYVYTIDNKPLVEHIDYEEVYDEDAMYVSLKGDYLSKLNTGDYKLTLHLLGLGLHASGTIHVKNAPKPDPKIKIVSTGIE